MNSSITMNLPVAVIGRQPAASENLSENSQGLFADALLGAGTLNPGENANLAVESDKMPFLSQLQNLTTAKEAFSEKFKKALATVAGSDVAETAANTNQLVLQQNATNEAVVADLTGIVSSAPEKSEIAVSKNSAEVEKKPEKDTPATETPDILAASSIVVPPVAVETPDISAANPIAVPSIETAILSPAGEKILTPVNNDINQSPLFAKSDTVKPALNINITAPAPDNLSITESIPNKLDTTIESTPNDTNTQKIFKNYTDAGIGASDKNFQNSSAVEPADNLTTADNAQSNQTEAAKGLNSTTEAKAVEVRIENPDPLPQTIAATKNSTVIKTADAGPKEQIAIPNQTLGQKANTPQIQPNTADSGQTPNKQNFPTKYAFGEIYREAKDIEGVSLENKNLNDLQMPGVQEIKTAGGSEKISSLTAVDLKTDIKQETGEISRQIADSIKSAVNSSEKEITVRLNPAELGRVVIKVSGEHSQISTIIEVSNPQTKSQLQDAFGSVAKNLADAGITLRQFEVRPAGPASQSGSGFESAFSQSGQSGQSGNGPAGQFFQGQNPTEGSFLYQNQNFIAENSSPEQNFSQNYFTARSVNMLA